jgi:hypothetical protein
LHPRRHSLANCVALQRWTQAGAEQESVQLAEQLVVHRVAHSDPQAVSQLLLQR